MQKNCARCREKTKNVYKVVVTHKLQPDLCEKCYNGWFDLRDRIVEETFREYVSSNKTK